jgi:hypothetical protein
VRCNYERLSELFLDSEESQNPVARQRWYRNRGRDFRSCDRAEPQRRQRKGASIMDMKLEVLVVPVSDVDRAKAFYEKLGFRLDIDYAANENFRVIQFTPMMPFEWPL